MRPCSSPGPLGGGVAQQKRCDAPLCGWISQLEGQQRVGVWQLRPVAGSYAEMHRWVAAYVRAKVPTGSTEHLDCHDWLCSLCLPLIEMKPPITELHVFKETCLRWKAEKYEEDTEFYKVTAEFILLLLTGITYTLTSAIAKYFWPLSMHKD